MSKPIRPDQVGATQRAVFPAAVFEAVNELIAENWNGSSATIRQDSIVARIIAKDGSIERHMVFDRGLLNFEDAYRDEGWRVEYDRPGYNETYQPTFKFTRGKQP